MQQVWLALIVGIIVGWLVEWLIDWRYWRKNLAALRRENGELREQLGQALQELGALRQMETAEPATVSTTAVEPSAAETSHAEGE